MLQFLHKNFDFDARIVAELRSRMKKLTFLASKNHQNHKIEWCPKYRLSASLLFLGLNEWERVTAADEERSMMTDRL